MKTLARIVVELLGPGFGAYCERVRHAQAHAVKVREDVSEPLYDFYRCEACHRLMTKLEEFSFFDPTSPTYGQVCPCGFRRYSPTNMLWWEWVYPRVWKFALIRVLEIA